MWLRVVSLSFLWLDSDEPCWFREVVSREVICWSCTSRTSLAREWKKGCLVVVSFNGNCGTEPLWKDWVVVPCRNEVGCRCDEFNRATFFGTRPAIHLHPLERVVEGHVIAVPDGGGDLLHQDTGVSQHGPGHCHFGLQHMVVEGDMVSIVDTDNPVDFKETGTIEFKNVGFAYPGSDKEAVSDISFKVKKGETIAFIGATGSGKTTIINMIPRMADCTSGEVLVDGVNVKDVLQSDLRDRIGYAPQRGFLFKGNIKDNIAFKDPEMTLQDVRWAAEIADADGFVMKKRNGYDSEVAQGGSNFSGGQKQRLCIARAVATKPEILIFDDSFSALDYKTDKTVRGRIAEELPDTTRVIIAQRVGTIMDADQIVVLDNGKMVGIGKHYDLVRNCPVYQEIALSQLSKEELGL